MRPGLRMPVSDRNCSFKAAPTELGQGCRLRLEHVDRRHVSQRQRASRVARDRRHGRQRRRVSDSAWTPSHRRAVPARQVRPANRKTSLLREPLRRRMRRCLRRHRRRDRDTPKRTLQVFSERRRIGHLTPQFRRCGIVQPPRRTERFQRVAQQRRAGID